MRILFVAMLAVCSACSSSTNDAGGTTSAPATSTVAPTTTAANRPPTIRALPVARAELGQSLSEAIIATDPDGDPLVVRIADGPRGFSPTVNARGTVTGFDWEPSEPGEWEVEVTATDPSGAVATSVVELQARAPRSTPLLLSMGDSIAAGFGRDRSDFLGRDECFRSERDTYAGVTTATLIDAGALGEDAEVVLVGCAGAVVSSLDTDAVSATSGSGSPLSSPTADGAVALTQVEWARRLNPTIVTMTIGGNDGLLFDVEQLFLPPSGGGQAVDIDEERLIEIGASIEIELRQVLDELLRTTDAHVALTTYYDPTAASPVGVDGCRASCMRAAMARVVTTTNDALIAAAQASSTERISIVRLDGDDDVWEAGNGAGPDFLRDGFGPLEGVFDNLTGGSSATCARNGEPPRDLVSSLDCVHPNVDGHLEIGNRVSDVLLSI